MTVSLKAESREEATKSDIKQLRVKGRIPAVVYGNKVAATAITVDQKELLALLRQNPHAIIDLEMPNGSGKQPVMINEIQRDQLKRERLLHIDFHQINMDEPVKTTVSLEFIGEAEGAKEGGIVQIQMHELEIRCLPSQIPNSIKVDISNVGLGGNLLVNQLSIPAGIEVKSDLNDLILTVLSPQKEAAEVDTPDVEKTKQADEAKAVMEEQTV
jgi:large subunit ribosomal protein L25